MIHEASTAADYAAFAGLVRDYVGWCRARYEDLAWFVDEVFGYQSLAAELAALRNTYGPPHGKTLLVTEHGRTCGAGAYRRLAEGTCEMKRVFIPDHYQGRGYGRSLCRALIETARTDGYSLMKLDTGKRLSEAIAMYESLGFAVCAPYHAYPAHLLPHLLFMELRLEDGNIGSDQASPSRASSLA